MFGLVIKFEGFRRFICVLRYFNIKLIFIEGGK